MLRYTLCSLLLLALSAPMQAQEAKEKPATKPLYESWQAAYFEGLKVGHLHTLARQVGKGDEARIQTKRTMVLVIKRYGSVLPISIEQTCEETATGKVLAIGLTQQIGTSPKTIFTGKVDAGKLTLNVRIGDQMANRELPFDDACLGLFAQEAIFQRKKVKSGDKLTIKSYEIMLAGVLTVHATVKDLEKVDQLVTEKTAEGTTKVVRQPVSLLRVEIVSDPVNVGGTEVKLPTKITWLDAKKMPVREQFEMPGLGLITLYTSTKEAALKEGVAPDRLPDFGLNINIPVKQTIIDPYKTSEATYRVTMKEKLDKVFSIDDRQKVREGKDNALELVVKAEREPGTDDSATPPSKDYLDTNVFIESDDARIKALSRAITRKIENPWRKAQALEKWVHDNMKVSSAVGFPSAAQIAKDLEGDCRQHALLLVALCRAAGIPARTAIGLIYVREPGRSPFFGFHMWAEVWVKGKWIALDAVLGQGSVGATHLKMADHSWAKTATLAPLLPISQTLGKLSIEVVESK